MLLAAWSAGEGDCAGRQRPVRRVPLPVECQHRTSERSLHFLPGGCVISSKLTLKHVQGIQKYTIDTATGNNLWLSVLLKGKSTRAGIEPPTSWLKDRPADHWHSRRFSLIINLRKYLECHQFNLIFWEHVFCNIVCCVTYFHHITNIWIIISLAYWRQDFIFTCVHIK